MAKSRRELDLTRNTIRRAESVKQKCLDASRQWDEIDQFIVQLFSEVADKMDEIISEINNRKTE